MEFNKEQQEVIEATGGYHLVLAPPGCGKTAVLAERIVWAREHGVEFSEMACLTFTNRASRGMRERIYERMPNAEGLDELFIGNVHRFCSQFLFQNDLLPEGTSIIDTDTSISILADYLGEDELRVLGDAKQRQRYSTIINLQHLMYQCEHHYPSPLMVHRDSLVPSLLRELCLAFDIDYTQEAAIELYRHADFYRDEGKPMSRDAQQLLVNLYAALRYERYKRENDLLDFEDLLLRTYDIMSTEPSMLSKIGLTATEDIIHKRFSWLQIDEVQDLNPLQLAIVDLFTAPNATVVYLGDAQQAIFSFMGAMTDTLQQLRERCGEGGFHNFYHNYRSPRYLLDVFNKYGREQLKIADELLPTTMNITPQRQGDLLLSYSETNIDEVNLVARMVKRLYEAYPDETTAVVVAFNSDADEISQALVRVPHFKVSGTDLFSTPDMRLLLAHLSVIDMEQNFIAWSQLFTGLSVYSSQSASRQFVHALMELAITPVDFLTLEGTTYVAEFVRTYEERDIVVFDTETTGLSVFDDDVVEIAAIRIRNGEIIDSLDLFIETEREILAMLGDVVNPLVEEYARQPHLSHREALERFVGFAADAAILGHNATYDYQIMEHNMQRYASELSMHKLWPDYLDSLKLIRLLKPRLRSYKLKLLLQELHLEGENSHLASDDILATLSLVNYCHEQARQLVGRQLEFCSRHRQTIEKFRRLYGELYAHAKSMLYVQQDEPALTAELRFAYERLREDGKVGMIGKIGYVERYIDIDLLTPESGQSLAEQLSRHVQDLTTLKEADLCGASSMNERVFVSTVHKAKGLEFDNVIVFDAVDGKYPSAYASTELKSDEEARKFYVAISRARRRLIVTWCGNSVSRYGRWFTKELTPYMDSIKQLFD